MFAGHVIVHAATAVTVNVQLPVRVAASVAVQVTVVVPAANVVPDAGEHATVAPGQLSLAVGVVYVTTPGGTPEMLVGQATVGG